MKKFKRLVNNRTKLLYAKIFESIEKKIPNVIKTDEWDNIRKNILDISNSIIRSTNDDFDDFEFSYRFFPFCISCDASGKRTIHLSMKMLDLFNRMDFLEGPFTIVIKVPTNEYNIDAFKHIQGVFLCGEIDYRGSFIYFTIKDPNHCMKITNIIDMIPLKPLNKKLYGIWKKKLKDWYLRYGDW